MKGQEGFTLIELLIVVAILGVLAVVLIPNLSNMLGIADLSAANTEADTVRVAVLAYGADNNHEYPEGNYDKDDLGDLRGYLEKRLKGSYTVNASGGVVGTGGWEGLTWVNGMWEKVED